MPIIKSAIKRAKQAKVRTARNRRYSSQMKSMIKLFLGHIKGKEQEKASKVLPEVVSIIDTCAKKNLIHKNNAARKKARIQKSLSNLLAGKEEVKLAVKKGAKKVAKAK